MRATLRRLKEHLADRNANKDLTFTDFAIQTGLLASGPHAAEALKTLKTSLKAIGQSRPPVGDLGATIHYSKTILGLGISIASLDSPQEQQTLLDDTFLRIVAEDSDYSLYCKRLVLNELTYVDQYLHGAHAEDPHGVRRRAMATILPLCRKYPWCSAVRDFALNCDLWVYRDKVTRSYSSTMVKPSLDVYLVCSVKGGVGKSTTAVTLFEYARRRLGKKTLLVDLDMSGPTAQYALDVPSCSLQLGMLPDLDTPTVPLDDIPRWCYPSLIDYCGSECPAAPPLLDLDDAGAGWVVAIPDSPTFAAHCDAYVSEDLERDVLIQGLQHILATAAADECSTVIVDLGPGIVAANGVVLRWLSHHYHTRIMLLTTARASDFANSVYEGTWASAMGEFGWQLPILHVINLWQSSSPPGTVLPTWANQFIWKCLKACVSAQQGPAATLDVTSADMIFFWRLWSYLYVLGVSRAEKQFKTISLPYAEEMRTVHDPPPENGRVFKLESDRIIDSPWGRQLVERVVGWEWKEKNH